MFLPYEGVVMILVRSLLHFTSMIKRSVPFSSACSVSLQVQIVTIDLFKHQLFFLLRSARSNYQLLQLIRLSPRVSMWECTVYGLG